jgi:hypothetical protein
MVAPSGLETRRLRTIRCAFAYQAVATRNIAAAREFLALGGETGAVSSPPVVVYGCPYLMDIGAMDVVQMIGIRVRGARGGIRPARSAGLGAPPHPPLPDDPVDGGTARGVEQLVEDAVAEILGKRLTTVAGVVALVRSAPTPHV